jgi:hypothetical protein
VPGAFCVALIITLVIKVKEKTMANKKKLLGMLVMALIFGITVVGCDNGSTNGNGNDDDNGSTPANTDPKTITITGLAGKSGNVEIVLGNIVNNDDVVIAIGQGTISDNAVTVPLKNKDSDTDWTGTGSYIIQLEFVVTDDTWFYTNGKTWAEIGITANTSEEEAFLKLPKYNIASATSTIAFDQFKK